MCNQVLIVHCRLSSPAHSIIARPATEGMNRLNTCSVEASRCRWGLAKPKNSTYSENKIRTCRVVAPPFYLASFAKVLSYHSTQHTGLPSAIGFAQMASYTSVASSCTETALTNAWLAKGVSQFPIKFCSLAWSPSCLSDRA